MSMKERHDGYEELARQLERDADNEEMWEQEPVKIERRPSKTSVLSLRLPTAEFRALLSAARQSGESVSDYVRKAIATRMSTQPLTTVISATGAYTATPSANALPEWHTYTAGSARQETTVSTR